MTEYRVSFTNKSVEALERLRAVTPYTETDLINRAVQAYAILEEEMMAGQELWLVKPRKRQWWPYRKYRKLDWH